MGECRLATLDADTKGASFQELVAPTPRNSLASPKKDPQRRTLHAPARDQVLPPFMEPRENSSPILPRRRPPRIPESFHLQLERGKDAAPSRWSPRDPRGAALRCGPTGAPVRRLLAGRLPTGALRPRRLWPAGRGDSPCVSAVLRRQRLGIQKPFPTTPEAESTLGIRLCLEVLEFSAVFRGFFFLWGGHVIVGLCRLALAPSSSGSDSPNTAPTERRAVLATLRKTANGRWANSMQNIRSWLILGALLGLGFPRPPFDAPFAFRVGPPWACHSVSLSATDSEQAP